MHSRCRWAWSHDDEAKNNIINSQVSTLNFSIFSINSSLHLSVITLILFLARSSDSTVDVLGDAAVAQ